MTLTWGGKRTLLFVAGFALLLAFTPSIVQAQAGTVEGHIFCADGNVPARGARVNLIPLDSLLKHNDGAKKAHLQSFDSSTDFNGNYVFPSVSVGTYVVYVQEAGYSSDFPLVRDALGRFTLSQQEKLLAEFPQITVGAGIAKKDVVIYRGAAIMGRVTVDTGGILGPSAVTATMVSSDLLGDMSSGQGQKPLDFSRGGQTDDRGTYRIAGLPAGTYRIQVRLLETYVHVFMDNGNISIKPMRTGTGAITVFAPDVLKVSDAKLIQIGDGDELPGVDITIPMSRLHSIGGIVTQDGNPVARAIIDISSQGHTVGNFSATTMPDGSYRFDLLPSGTYTIQAKPFGQPDSSHTNAHITVQLMGNNILEANIDLPDSAAAN